MRSTTVRQQQLPMPTWSNEKPPFIHQANKAWKERSVVQSVFLASTRWSGSRASSRSARRAQSTKPINEACCLLDARNVDMRSSPVCTIVSWPATPNSQRSMSLKTTLRRMNARCYGNQYKNGKETTTKWSVKFLFIAFIFPQDVNEGGRWNDYDERWWDEHEEVCFTDEGQKHMMRHLCPRSVGGRVFYAKARRSAVLSFAFIRSTMPYLETAQWRAPQHSEWATALGEAIRINLNTQVLLCFIYCWKILFCLVVSQCTDFVGLTMWFVVMFCCNYFSLGQQY